MRKRFLLIFRLSLISKIESNLELNKSNEVKSNKLINKKIKKNVLFDRIAGYY